MNFVGTAPGDWFDTGNWCESDGNGGCASSQPARLDTEKIPCRQDDIVFPPNKVFYVNVTFGSTLTVARLTIGAQVCLDNLANIYRKCTRLCTVFNRILLSK